MPENHIMIPFNNGCHNLDVRDILYIECQGKYCDIHTITSKYPIYLSLTVIEDTLKTNNFVRIHQSYVIPLARVASFKDGQVTLRGIKPGDKISLPMGKTYCITDRYRTLKAERKERRK